MPYTGGVVLFGQEKEPSISNGTSYQDLGTYGAPGTTGYFPSTTEVADRSLQIGDDLWVAVAARPARTGSTIVISTAMDPAWNPIFTSTIDVSTTLRAARDITFYNYGPSPVDAAGWSAWAPEITVQATGLTFPTSLPIFIRPFAIRNAQTAPQFTAFLAGADTDPREPDIDTWTGTGTYAIGFVGGPSYTGGGAGAGNIALYPSGDGPINGWDLAQGAGGAAFYNRTWYGRVTTDTAAPAFVIGTAGWFWFGFQIPSEITPVASDGWSIDTISY